MTTDVTAILITNVTCVTFYIPQGTKATYASHLVLLETSIQGNDHRMGHVAEISERQNIYMRKRLRKGADGRIKLEFTKQTGCEEVKMA